MRSSRHSRVDFGDQASKKERTSTSITTKTYIHQLGPPNHFENTVPLSQKVPTQIFLYVDLKSCQLTTICRIEMAEIGSLESFQALYNNLCALPEQQFSNLDRLGAELDAHVEYFRNLLDKKAKDGASRQALSSGGFSSTLHSKSMLILC